MLLAQFAKWRKFDPLVSSGWLPYLDNTPKVKMVGRREEEGRRGRGGRREEGRGKREEGTVGRRGAEGRRNAYQ